MNRADVIIVGGGIIGCGAAYYLAKKGISVIVLEGSDYIGEGGSSRNGGGVRQSGRDPRELPMVMWGIRNLWPFLSDELEVDTEYRQKGNLRLGKNEVHLKILQNLTDNALKCGLDMRMIDAKEIKEINPYLSDEVIGASWCPTDGHANPLTTTLGYYKTARNMGVRFITGEKVTHLKKSKGRIGAVVTENGSYFGEKVAVCAGYPSREVLKSVGIDIPFIPQKMECLVTEAVPQMFEQMLGTAMADFYGHQSRHGSFVFGGSTGFELYNEDNGHLINTNNSAAATCRGIMEYFPALKDTKIVRSWTGFIDTCSDGIPVISKIDEVDGLYAACAFTGHGFGIGPAAAYSLAQLLSGGEAPVDMTDFRYDRFKSKI